MLSEEAIEAEIQEKGLTAPRLTPEHIDRVISRVTYHIVPGTACTICSIVLANGFVVEGLSAPVSMHNFNPELGEKIAFDAARDKIWMLEGYLLRQKLFESGEA